MRLCILCRKYSKVKEWTLGLSGGRTKIAVIRAVGGISRARGGLGVSGDGIVSDTFIEKIRRVRGFSLASHSSRSDDDSFLYCPMCLRIRHDSHSRTYVH